MNKVVTPDFPLVGPQLLRKRTRRFCCRILLATGIIALSSACMLSGCPLLFIIGLFVQGAMYIHLIELQHSVLHLQVFHSHTAARVVGFLLGLPMMISFSDFQYRHLRHHKYLGTALNTETFNYQHTELNSPLGFLRGMLDYSRWQTMLIKIAKSFAGRNISDGENHYMEQRIREEYKVMGLVLASTILYCVLSSNAWPLVLWLVPLIAAEPVHFLLELPEHFGLPAHTNVVVFQNTRSWGGSLFARWFTHNTNYHVAHHYNMLVPMDNLPEVQKLIDEFIPESSRSRSYFHFYVDVITGKLTARPDEPETTAGIDIDLDTWSRNTQPPSHPARIAGNHSTLQQAQV